MSEGTAIDRQLLAARAGSTDALGEALETCRAYLLLVANQELDPKLSAKGGASDLVQQTFIEAQHAFHRFQGTSNVEWRAWLRRLLLNNVMNFRRHWEESDKRRSSREEPLDERPSVAGDEPTPSQAAMADERAAAVRTAMAKLPEAYRTVLTLRHEDDLPFEIIAERMARSADAVRKLWCRAVESLECELGSPP